MRRVNLNGTKTILYVEDDSVTMTAYRNRLQEEGFQVKVARDGLEAMKMLSMSAPDLILMDLMLPKFNGDEVLKFIYANASLRTLPVMILSTNSIRDAATESILERANRRFLKETCNMQTLISSIRELLFGPEPKKIAPEFSRNSFSVNQQLAGSFATA